MDLNCIIVDDFLPNPDLVRQQALNLEYFNEDGYPGVRSLAADHDYQTFIIAMFRDILNCKIGEFVMDSFCFQACMEDAKTWVHKDKSGWAGVLYLTPDAPYEAGTGIFAENKSGEFDLVTAIGNVYNRLVLYRADQLHSSIQAGFGTTIDTCRLTQVFFFNLEGTPGGL